MFSLLSSNLFRPRMCPILGIGSSTLERISRSSGPLSMGEMAFCNFLPRLQRMKNSIIKLISSVREAECFRQKLFREHFSGFSLQALRCSSPQNYVRKRSRAFQSLLKRQFQSPRQTSRPLDTGSCRGNHIAGVVIEWSHFSNKFHRLNILAENSLA